jgi:regulator of protease activity HflC (stomatin/prohibitin superfamily)
VRLGDIWALSFVRERLLVVILGTTLLAWAGSMFTAVPTGGQGVRVRLGHFIEPALEPGLHVGWPWPFERVEVVETGALRELSLGFERDIGGAILWAEKHFEGEKNLLVGSGEELLTVNVPIYFRIADPVAYLRHTADATIALTHLAERHLLALTAGHESFRLMTIDRDATAAELRRRLQTEADALRLGIAIAFVGLKDIHPPVAVAPAYQDVVSAEEEKEAHIYIGRQYAASVIPLAQEEANRLRTNARAEAASRLASCEW